MAPGAKFLIGLAAVLIVGIVYHGPLGGGERFIERLEARAANRVEVTELDGIRVSFPRAPLSRLATITGEANSFQRDGLGSFPGLTERIETIPGVSGVRWADEPEKRSIPLLVETLFLLVLAYLAGIGLGRLLFGRKKRESFLD